MLLVDRNSNTKLLLELQKDKEKQTFSIFASVTKLYISSDVCKSDNSKIVYCCAFFICDYPIIITLFSGNFVLAVTFLMSIESFSSCQRT